MQRNQPVSPMTATALLALGIVVFATTGWRSFVLHKQLAETRAENASARGLSDKSLLARLSIPVNRPLRICNTGAGDLNVSALAATYWAPDGNLRVFSSAQHDWHTWQLKHGQGETMQLQDGSPTSWDGSAVFYAVEFQRHDGSTGLLTGTSTDLSDSCIRTSSE